MYEKIKELIDQIKKHEHLHNITIFNKQKNSQNLFAHNIAQGRLIQLLMQFHYFNHLNLNLGAQFLLKAIQFIEPYFLRKDKVLVNAKQNNYPAQYLIVQGIISVYQIINQQNDEDEDKVKKTLIFSKYLSNGAHINFIDYNEKQFQLFSHQNCQMIKLPNRQNLDPLQYSKKNSQNNVLIERSSQIQKLRSMICECIQKVSRQKKLQLQSSFGLGQYDINHLLIDGDVQKIPIHRKIYQSGEMIQKIGFILKGRIIQVNKQIKVNRFVSYDSAILTLYKKNFNSDKSKIQKNETVLDQSEWIGLQQFLKNLQIRPFRVQELSQNILSQHQGSAKFVKKKIQIVTNKDMRAAEDCQVLWIPIQSFARKFNYQVSFTTIDQWRGIVDIKEEAKWKNDKIQEQFKTQKQQRQNTHYQLPKIYGNVEQMGHNLSKFSRKTEFKSKIISQKQQKFGKLLNKNVKISQTSLLGITMRRHSEFQSISQRKTIQQNNYKKFSHFSRLTLNKKFDGPANHKKSPSLRKQRKVFSDYKIQPQSLIYDSPEDLIMYPEAYQPSKLPPDLRKQLFMAQKACRLQAVEQSVPGRHRSICLQNSRSDSVQQKNITNADLSLMGSKSHLPFQMVQPSSPQKIYKNIIQKISFKYPRLQSNLRAQIQYRKRSRNIQKVSIKERTQTLKVLDNFQRKRMKKSRQQQTNLINRNSQKNPSTSMLELFTQHR